MLAEVITLFVTALFNLFNMVVKVHFLLQQTEFRRQR